MISRSRISALVFALSIALIAPRILAQAQTQTDMSQAGLDPETQAKVEKRLKHISSELNLSEDQKRQIKPIVQKECQQLKALDNDTSMSADQKQAKAQKIRQDAKADMATILTPDQQRKLAALKEQPEEEVKKE
jgi:Spy/CpxP family protein refolding chaperone